MTPDHVKKLIARADASQIVMAFEGLDESERKKLAPTVSQIKKEFRALDRVVHPHRTAPFLREFATAIRPAKLDKQHDAADLCVLGACSITDVRQIDEWRLLGLDQQALVRILCDRRPSWLDAWLETWVSSEWALPSWKVFTTLVKEAGASVPTSDSFAEYLVQAMYDHHPAANATFGSIPLADRIASSPLVLEHLWRIFEVETHAFKHDYYLSPGKQRWPDALVELAGRGVLDRQRLLDVSLAALSGGFQRNMVSGLARFHVALDPTPSERLARQHEYFGLLGSADTAASGLAVSMLKPLANETGLNVQAFAGAAPAVFDQRIKRNAVDVLGLARKLGRTEGARPALLPLATAALGHPHEDVQARGIDLLQSWTPDRGSPEAAALSSEIRGRLPGVSAVVRDRVEQLIALLSGDEEPAPNEEPEEIDLDDILGRISAIPQPIARITGVADARSALEAARLPGPLAFDVLDAPMLVSAAPIAPIESIDELFDAVAHIVEVVDSADELERVLDGIVRLCADEAPDFARRAEPLLKRIGWSAAESSELDWLQNLSSALYHFEGPVTWVCVINNWLSPDSPPPSPIRWMEVGRFTFVNERMIELSQRVARREGGPMLSAPTHSGGWIDPSVLVDRIRELRRLGIEAGRLDLIAALLRLAPERRQRALNEAHDLPGNIGDAVRFALGGTGPNERSSDSALWLAAGRCRTPVGLIKELVGTSLDVPGPNGTHPAQPSWRPQVWKARHASLDIRTQSFRKEDPAPEHPSVVLNSHLSIEEAWASTKPWQVHWLANVWPLNPDSVLTAGAQFLAYRLEDTAASSFPNHAHLEPLFHPDTPWSEMARLAVWMGIVSLDQDARGTAIDAMIEGIEDGRVHPEAMGETIAKLNVPGWLKMNRVAESLREIARVSDLHAWAACGCLDALIASCQTTPRDLHHVLALYQELLVRLGHEAGEETKAFLATVSGSGKTARLARTISALTASRGTEAIAIRMLEQRLIRAERWCNAGSVRTDAASEPAESAR